MFENRLGPQNVGGKVTEDTVGRESGCLMVGIGGGVVVLGMTTVALAGQIGSGYMTLGAVEAGMSTLKGPNGTMIEVGSFPGLSGGAVTGLAIGGEPH